MKNPAMKTKKPRGAPPKEDRDDVLDQTVAVKMSRNQKRLLQEAAGPVPLARWARDHLLEIAKRELAEAEK